MINEEYKEFFEEMFVGFTKAVFAGVHVPSMYMVIVGKDAEVIPEPLKGMTTEVYAELVASYANVKRAQFIAYVTPCLAIPAHVNEKSIGNPHEHPDRQDMLMLLIGDPRGELDVITGYIEKAIDGSPYVSDWAWRNTIDNISKRMILPFTD